MISVRFAPTISGSLHAGSLYNCYLTWKFAKEHGGKFYLRLDGQHIDRKGTRKQYADSIEGDLRYFGFKFDSVIRQYERKERYKKEFIKYVIDSNRDSPYYDIYYCDCTSENITDRIVGGVNVCGFLRTEKYDVEKLGHSRIGFGVMREYLYDGYCRKLDKKLDLDNPLTVVRIKCRPPMLDVALWFDGQPDLCWTSIYDDMEMGITHRIRGIDIEPFTWLEREAARTLNYNPDNNLFHGLIVGESGKKLSKFTGALRLTDCLNSELTKEKVFEWYNSLPGIGDVNVVNYMK